jgi:hypothetical protein
MRGDTPRGHSTRHIGGVGAVIAMSLLILTVGVEPVTAASKACRVRNTHIGKSYSTLQAAIDAASKADRLLVSGTCIGTTIIGKDVVIAGTRNSHRGETTLSGGNRVRVLLIKIPARVRLRDLHVVRGNAKHGGAILNRGHLLLRDVVVSGSHSPLYWPGGGVANLGTLTLNGASAIRDNGPTRPVASRTTSTPP